MTEPTVWIKLTEKELWALLSGFEQSYEEGHPDNRTEDRVANILRQAHSKFG